MSSSKDIAARSCSRSSAGRLANTSSITSCGRSGASSAISSASRVPVGRDQLLGVHRGDQRLADRIRDLDQDVAVAGRADEVPDVQPLVERQRLEDVRDVGRVQPVELALELRLVLLGDEALDELAATYVVAYRCVFELLVDEPFHQPVLAQQRRDLDERVLDALARLGAFARLFFDGLGHDGVGAKNIARRVRTGRILPPT